MPVLLQSTHPAGARGRLSVIPFAGIDDTPDQRSLPKMKAHAGLDRSDLSRPVALTKTCICRLVILFSVYVGQSRRRLIRVSLVHFKGVVITRRAVKRIEEMYA